MVGGTKMDTKDAIFVLFVLFTGFEISKELYRLGRVSETDYMDYLEEQSRVLKTMMEGLNEALGREKEGISGEADYL